MKKLFTLAVALTVAFAGFAQNKNGKGHKARHEKHMKNKSHDDRYDNDDRRINRKRDVNGTQTGKYSKNLPSKVRAAFNRDFPNATNVSWTKDRGYWTATFPNGILNRASVTYAANGTRVNGNSVNRRTNTNENVSVWDKIFSRTN